MDEEEWDLIQSGPKRRMFLWIITPDGVVTVEEGEQQSCLFILKKHPRVK